MRTRIEKKGVPNKPVHLMWAIYRDILPLVQRQLDYWQRRATQIPNEELRFQALASLTSKQFHCEGGGVYALLAPREKQGTILTFIVAYQTISDYLDNLCDRSMSLDGENFRLLHQSMIDAVSGTISTENYYAHQTDQDDGGYLLELVKTCHQAIAELATYHTYQAPILSLCQLYCDLQVYKHIALDKREEALLSWWSEHCESFTDLSWYEFAAATGSTLGIFYYIALASDEETWDSLDQKVFEAYFPYVQGLHILLDYLIDQEEDRQEGDLNFCFYYKSDAEKIHRFDWFTQRAINAAQDLPQSNFHCMVIQGLLGMYLSQKKVKKQSDVQHISKKLLKKSKLSTWFFYANAWYMHLKTKKKQEG